MKPASLLAIMSAMLNEKIFMANQEFQQRGYYYRYTGKSKTFKKNKRRGL